MRRAAVGLALIGFACSPAPAAAQLAGSNLLLAQVGNYPGYEPTNRQDLYDQVNLAYGFSAGQVGMRFETDRNTDQTFTYAGLAQRWADLSDGRYRLRVGNFYTILGRGLLHRSFELPGVVLDQIGLRSRYAFSREMDGALGEVSLGPVDARLFSGTANSGENSLAADAAGLPRYAGQFSGGQLAGTVIRGARIGAAYARGNAGSSPTDESGSGFADVDAARLVGLRSVAVPLYYEYAQSNQSLGDWWKMNCDASVPHALYASAGMIWNRLGFSAEWKDYSQFRKGTNDPPSLVPEQSYVILNRDTHVLDATREVGYQLEMNGSVTDRLAFTANQSHADGLSINRYREDFVELRVVPGPEPWDASAFFDAMEDGLSFLDDSRSYGGGATVRFLGAWSARLDLEHQTAQHPNGSLPPTPFENSYLSFTTSRADWGSVAVVWDRTSDPLVRSVFSGGGTFLDLVSGVIGARLSPQNEATLTFGRQRGGRACTAGTCYEVQPFEGVELRVVSRF